MLSQNVWLLIGGMERVFKPSVVQQVKEAKSALANATLDKRYLKSSKKLVFHLCGILWVLSTLVLEDIPES